MKRIVIVTEEGPEENGLVGIYTDSHAPFEIVGIHLAYDEWTDDEGLPENRLGYSGAHRIRSFKLSEMPPEARRAWRQYLHPAPAR